MFLETDLKDRPSQARSLKQKTETGGYSRLLTAKMSLCNLY